MIHFETVRDHWWALLLRGILALLFGIACFFLTGLTLVVLVYVIGWYFIIDGVVMLVGAARSLRTAGTGHWWWLLIGGILGIIAGAFTFMWPGLTALWLALLVGAWAIVTGVLELAAAIRLRDTMRNEWLWVLNGLLSIALGVAIFAFPGAGLVGLVYLLGFYAVLAGVTMIGLSLRLRGTTHVPA